jgi:F0F1-type ATP synthase assembly protein I
VSRPKGDRGGTEGPSGVELLGLGLGIAVAVVLPLLLGILFDAARHTSPLGVGVGLLLGIVAAIALIYQRFNRYW